MASIQTVTGPMAADALGRTLAHEHIWCDLTGHSNGAVIIYGPHANATGGNLAGWYTFRAKWGGFWNPEITKVKRVEEVVDLPAGGWTDGLNVYAALHNHAGFYNAEWNPPAGPDKNEGWASGAWFIGPDGQTLGQMPTSMDKKDSQEFILIENIPLKKP